LTNDDEFMMGTTETVVEGTFEGNDKGIGFV